MYSGFRVKALLVEIGEASESGLIAETVFRVGKSLASGLLPVSTVDKTAGRLWISSSHTRRVQQFQHLDSFEVLNRSC